MQTAPTSTIIELFFEFSRLMKGNMAVKSELANLSMLQMQALVFVATNPNVTMSEIAKSFSIELSSASSLIDHLHEMGIVQRKHDTKDRRKICIILTKKGVELVKAGKKIRTQRMEKILSFLSEAEKGQLQKILEKLCRSMEESHE